MTRETKGLYLTKQQWETMLGIIKTSIEYDEFDVPDYKNEDLMQFYKDRAILHNTIEELLS